jgi:Rieske Fe-S protein
MSNPATNLPPPNRRGFFQLLVYVTGLVAAAAVAVPFVGYLLGALKKKTAPWVDLGAMDKFPKGETRLHVFDNPIRQPWDGMTAHTGVYVRNLGKVNAKQEFLVFAINCTHLGCPVTWFPQSGLFMCPCHGGVYYENGEHASGPPPRGLYHCPWRISENGKNLEVQAPHLPTLQDTLELKKSKAT